MRELTRLGHDPASAVLVVPAALVVPAVQVCGLGAGRAATATVCRQLPGHRPAVGPGEQRLSGAEEAVRYCDL